MKGFLWLACPKDTQWACLLLPDKAGETMMEAAPIIQQWLSNFQSLVSPQTFLPLINCLLSCSEVEVHPTKDGGQGGQLLVSFWEGEDAAGRRCLKKGWGMVLQQNALARQPGEICTMVGGSSTLPATAGFPVSCIAGIWHSLVASR